MFIESRIKQWLFGKAQYTPQHCGAGTVCITCMAKRSDSMETLRANLDFVPVPGQDKLSVCVVGEENFSNGYKIGYAVLVRYPNICRYQLGHWMYNKDVGYYILSGIDMGLDDRTGPHSQVSAFLRALGLGRDAKWCSEKVTADFINP